MSGTPVWQNATSGQAPKAAHVNQFLGAHPSTELYTGTQTAAVVTNGAAHTDSNAVYLAQSFSTAVGQTQIGYVSFPLTSSAAVGVATFTTTLNVHANAAGAPTGSALSTATITTEYARNVTGGVDTVYISCPLPTSGLTASTTYWLVTTPAGDGTNHFSWRRSASGSGASTSANGSTWAAQAYGFQYQVFDQSLVTPLIHTWEDSGARWTWSRYTALSLVDRYAEYTAGQTATGYSQSFRSLTYSGNLLTGVS